MFDERWSISDPSVISSVQGTKRVEVDATELVRKLQARLKAKVRELALVLQLGQNSLNTSEVVELPPLPEEPVVPPLENPHEWIDFIDQMSELEPVPGAARSEDAGRGRANAEDHLAAGSREGDVAAGADYFGAVARVREALKSWIETDEHHDTSVRRDAHAGRVPPLPRTVEDGPPSSPAARTPPPSLAPGNEVKNPPPPFLRSLKTHAVYTRKLVEHSRKTANSSVFAAKTAQDRSSSRDEQEDVPRRERDAEEDADALNRPKLTSVERLLRTFILQYLNLIGIRFLHEKTRTWWNALAHRVSQLELLDLEIHTPTKLWKFPVPLRSKAKSAHPPPKGEPEKPSTHLPGDVVPSSPSDSGAAKDAQSSSPPLEQSVFEFPAPIFVKSRPLERLSAVPSQFQQQLFSPTLKDQLAKMRLAKQEEAIAEEFLYRSLAQAVIAMGRQLERDGGPAPPSEEEEDGPPRSLEQQAHEEPEEDPNKMETPQESGSGPLESWVESRVLAPLSMSHWHDLWLHFTRPSTGEVPVAFANRTQTELAMKWGLLQGASDRWVDAEGKTMVEENPVRARQGRGAMRFLWDQWAGVGVGTRTSGLQRPRMEETLAETIRGAELADVLAGRDFGGDGVWKSALEHMASAAMMGSASVKLPEGRTDVLSAMDRVFAILDESFAGGQGGPGGEGAEASSEEEPPTGDEELQNELDAELADIDARLLENSPTFWYPKNSRRPQLLASCSEALLKRLGLIPPGCGLELPNLPWLNVESPDALEFRFHVHLRAALVYAEFRVRRLLLEQHTDNASEVDVSARVSENLRMFAEFYGLLSTLDPDPEFALVGVWQHVARRFRELGAQASGLLAPALDDLLERATNKQRAASSQTPLKKPRLIISYEEEDVAESISFHHARHAAVERLHLIQLVLETDASVALGLLPGKPDHHQLRRPPEGSDSDEEAADVGDNFRYPIAEEVTVRGIREYVLKAFHHARTAVAKREPNFFEGFAEASNVSSVGGGAVWETGTRLAQ